MRRSNASGVTRYNERQDVDASFVAADGRLRRPRRSTERGARRLPTHRAAACRCWPALPPHSRPPHRDVGAPSSAVRSWLTQYRGAKHAHHGALGRGGPLSAGPGRGRPVSRRRPQARVRAPSAGRPPPGTMCPAPRPARVHTTGSALLALAGALSPLSRPIRRTCHPPSSLTLSSRLLPSVLFLQNGGDRGDSK